MEASQINPEKYGGNFEPSSKIEYGKKIEIASVESFTSKNEGFKGVSVTDKDGSKHYSTVLPVVNFLLGEKFAELLKSSNDGLVSVYFKMEENDPKFSTRKGSHLVASLFP